MNENENEFADYGGLHPLVAWSFVGLIYTMLTIGFAHLLLWGI